MLIKEQMRKYKVKMEEISQLEAAESIAFRRLSLLRQNTVSTLCGGVLRGGVVERGLGGSGPVSRAWVRTGSHFTYRQQPWPQAAWSGASSYLNPMITALPCLFALPSQGSGKLSPSRWCFILQPWSLLTWAPPTGF